MSETPKTVPGFLAMMLILSLPRPKSIITMKWLICIYFYHVFLSLQFEKPGRREDFDYPDMAKEAGYLKIYFFKVLYVI